MIQHKDLVIPIEVKYAENLQAKSLKSFYAKYANPISVRTSLSDFRYDGWLVNIPLYSIYFIEEILGKMRFRIGFWLFS